MVFYTGFRLLFYIFNASLFPDVSLSDFITILKGGLMFDISTLFYLNSLYAFLYLLPLPFAFSNTYQKILKILFIIINSIGFAFNCIDLVYYRFILKRTTYNVLNILENEVNMLQLFGQFLVDYWYVLAIFVVSIMLLHFSYSLLKPKPLNISKRWLKPVISLVAITLFATMSVIGMRGGYRHSTRPINMANAGKFVNSPDEMALVLNTPFCIIRTWGKKSFTSYNYYDSEIELEKIYNPTVNVDTTTNTQHKNVVIIILESFNKELFSSKTFNPHLESENYNGYTPFLDSLAHHSLIFTNTFANGRKSIDAMPSVLASIPALVLPYVVSEYSSNKINGLPYLLKKEGYETAFFHGAPNGSMGFDAFANVASFDKYYGMTEYNNDDDFDDMWGIWDEPFMQFYAQEMNKMQEPFMTSLFSLSSHHPFKVPEQYTNTFPKGTLPIHQCVGYTDNALRNFFNTASTMPWYENTLFVITADHSTASHFPISKTSTNKFQIPLMFYSHGDTSLVGSDSNLAQQIDIMPTVLNYLGYNKVPYVAFGNNLLDSHSKHFAINYTNGAYQLMVDETVLHYDGENIISAFNFKEDPSLANNLKDKDTTYLQHLPFMQAIIQQYNNRMIEDRLIIEEMN